MPEDLYTHLADLPAETQKAIADVLILRSAEHQGVEMRRRYFDWLGPAEGGRAAELGSGPGDIAADLLAQTGLSEVIGLDPSGPMVALAAKRFGATDGLSFVEGDARNTTFADASFDAVIFHTSLCHIPDPDSALAEAFRILKPGGRIAVFDVDWASLTLSIGPDDPLQTCAAQIQLNQVYDTLMCRTVPRRLRDQGFIPERTDAHPLMAEGEAPYFLSFVDRGADFLLQAGTITPSMADDLKSEGRARVAQGRFFGFLLYVSTIAHKPEAT